MAKRGIIYYYSGSGNTKLAVNYIAGSVKEVIFDLCDIVREQYRPFDEYDIVGFACFSDAWDVSRKMKDFIGRLPASARKKAFVFNTYGCISGKTLLILKKLVKKKGFDVIAGHSLHCPENYPPMIVGGHGFENSPSMHEKEAFDLFIKELDEMIGTTQKARLGKKKISIKMMDRLLPAFIAKLFGVISGTRFIFDSGICTACGKCVSVCPYGAVKVVSSAEIDLRRCRACWACYNHCPVQAIYTKSIRGRGQYKMPNEHLRKMLRLP